MGTKIRPIILAASTDTSLRNHPRSKPIPGNLNDGGMESGKPVSLIPPAGNPFSSLNEIADTIPTSPLPASSTTYR
ncbi:hypothetical protein DSO57_1039404 [Entomophthora muscae]|uniref:Uncharacterized protein n=1 Tax=Entomophthora muscae TaxID=34485 RepID=A0ACC2RD62_9FUNG|nr:hypothetical protein DSO57_1039404 [Entomophthora muscae]